MMNKRGNIFLGIAIGLFLFITGILFLPFITDDIDTFRAEMDCSDTSISDGDKLTCLFGDILIPYFIWFLVSVVVGFIIGR